MNNDELHNLAMASAHSLGEHFDNVQIFCSVYDSESGGTKSVQVGIGNWFARYGQVSEWYERQTETGRIECRKEQGE